ncbi:unnamed protein product [Urochloa humidicola]
MASGEDKIDLLLKEVKALQIGQLKAAEKMETVHNKIEGLNTWSVDAKKFSTGLSNDIADLKSRIAALEAIPTAPPKVPLREEGGRASGHRENTNNQGDDVGNQLPHTTLVKGEHKLPSSARYTFDQFDSGERKGFHNSSRSDPRDFKLPKLDFPKFNGDNPRVWREKCEKYFSVYRVPVSLWVSFATINFRGNAELWMQSYEAQYSIDSWPDLCIVVEEKFGRDLYQNNMRDLLAIKQTSDVLEYAERFEQAKHKVLLHNKDMGEVFFVQKFLDGLNFHISSAIALHRPRIVDSALSMAIMQEQILEVINKLRSPRPREHSRFSSRNQQQAGSSSTAPATQGVLATAPSKDKQRLKPRWDDKLSALRAARWAKGLCMKCGEPYSPQHRCPTHVPLHIMEEMLEALQLDEQADNTSDTSSRDSDEELLILSYCAAARLQGRKSMRLHGLIKNQEVLILIDSGSSATFISNKLVQQLKLSTTTATPVQVTVADSSKMISDQTVTDLSWWSQGHSFTSTARVLSLGYYDVIQGMDWLEQHSPMWVDWKRKKMRFHYQGQRITLTGVKDCLEEQKVERNVEKESNSSGGTVGVLYCLSRQIHNCYTSSAGIIG